MEWVVLNWNKNAIDFYKKWGAQDISHWIPFRITREKLIEKINE